MWRVRPLLSGCVAAWAGLAWLPAQDPAPELTLPHVLEAVRARHPALSAAQGRVAAQEAEVTSEGAWEDPMVALTVRRDNRQVFSAQEFELEVAQELPLSGSRRLAADVARAEVIEARRAVDAQELELLTQARRSYYELAYLESQLAVLAKTDRLLGEVIADLQAKYSAGQRPQSDLLTVQLEQVTLQEAVSTLRGQAAAQRAKLNVLMSAPPAAPLGTVTPLTFDFDVNELEAYVQAARTQHPELLAAAAAVDRAEAAQRVADRRHLPDPELRLMLRRMNGSNALVDSVDTGVAVRLPWVQRGKYRAIEAAARAARAAEEDAYAATQQVLLGRVSELWHLLASYRDCCLLYRDQAVPLAEAAVDAARRDFAQGRIPLADLLNATRNVLRVESELNGFLREYYLGFSELLQASGLARPLP